jgi:hypothetical protein
MKSLNYEKHSGGATKVVIGKADALALTPRIYVRQLFLIFSRSIYMGETGFLRSTASPS